MAATQARAGLIAAAVASGVLRAEEAVGAALTRLRERDGELRAFVEVRAGAALAEAREWDERLARGEALPPWVGVPFAIKGLGDPREVALLRAAGAVPIGRTSTPRGPGPQTWGHTDRGPTRNPHRSDLSPGGSSAGSAAAVGAGIVPVATGSDGAGSTRIPAAWCAVTGYKPTTGLVPTRDPTGLAVAAPLVADPRDLAGWAAIVLGPLPEVAPPRTAVWSADLGFVTDLDEEVVAIARAAARRLGPELLDLPVRLHDPAAAWASVRSWQEGHHAAVDWQHGGHAAKITRRLNDRALDELFGSADLLLTPTTPGPAHGHDGPGERVNVALTWAFNLSGHPAVSIPAGRTAAGAPVGLQVIARRGADAALLLLAVGA